MRFLSVLVACLFLVTAVVSQAAAAPSNIRWSTDAAAVGNVYGAVSDSSETAPGAARGSADGQALGDEAPVTLAGEIWSAQVAVGVAAKNGVPLGPGVTTRKINWRPNAADPNWGLTGTHVNKHLFGNSEYALNKIDPGGNADIWRGYMQDLASRPATGTTSNGMLDIVGTFPRTGGSGSFQFGIRLAPGSDGSFDLITLLTKQ